MKNEDRAITAVVVPHGGYLGELCSGAIFSTLNMQKKFILERKLTHELTLGSQQTEMASIKRNELFY